MDVITGWRDVPAQAKGAVLAIGNFDGVHRGHQAMLSRLTEAAEDLRLPSAILTFEPRILPATLQIRTLLEAGDLDHHNVIGVEILGELWAQPVPLEFLVRTEFDLETGKVQIADLAPTRVA